MAIPKVFISYSHDTQQHKSWVLDLATRLRHNGIDAVIDQWELHPGDDLALFMEKHLTEANIVIMVCTQKYVNKANKGIGGVGYEKMIVTSDFMSNIDSSKVIPIIRQRGSYTVPNFLSTKKFINFSRKDDFEFNFDELVRTIHKAPLINKPEVGSNPYTNESVEQPNRMNDSLIEFMTAYARVYEEYKGEPVDLLDICRKFDKSLILTELLAKEAVQRNLLSFVRIDEEEWKYFLEDEGRLFVVENQIVS
ncbi:MAG: toll/interleukin-1 receptor domain-containing protein [Algicola sp.]|nr:toll/interleukin-1 receptor domain-containing protein [Algicola sp.]